MTEVIKWLESPEGEAWSRSVNYKYNSNQCVYVCVKDDADGERSFLWFQDFP